VKIGLYNQGMKDIRLRRLGTWFHNHTSSTCKNKIGQRTLFWYPRWSDQKRSWSTLNQMDDQRALNLNQQPSISINWMIRTLTLNLNQLNHQSPHPQSQSTGWSEPSPSINWIIRTLTHNQLEDQRTLHIYIKLVARTY
jgi:hypothetical protein